MIHLSDIFIGDFPVAEYFAANPEVYTARFNLQGCPGIRFKCPTLTPILATAPGYVLETGFEEAGRGKFITLVHDGFLTRYSHLNDILVTANEKVIAGQLIGHSNQSGLTDFPCLLFEVAPCDKAGNKTEQNGYGGAIDPLNDNLITWDIRGLKEPITKQATAETMEISSEEYATLSAQATQLKVIINALKKEFTFDDYIQEIGEEPVDLTTNPSDSTIGQKVHNYLTTIAEEMEKEEQELPQETKEVAQTELPVIPLAKPEPFLLRLWHGFSKFLFTTV
ncbi:MAG TPA: M23 family metallopeptidase [Clostridia bacterium]